jgi:hypothetical protein
MSACLPRSFRIDFDPVGQYLLTPMESLSFADPHPLSSFVSYRYKNLGGRGLAATRPESPMDGEPEVAARTVCATKLIEAHLSAAPLTCIFRAPNMALQSFTAHSQVTGEDDFPRGSRATPEVLKSSETWHLRS